MASFRSTKSLILMVALAGCSDSGSSGPPSNPSFRPRDDSATAADGGQTPPATTDGGGEGPAAPDAAVPGGPDASVDLGEPACDTQCQVFTCRYKAVDGSDSCTDYYAHHGWTAQTASAHCTDEANLTKEHKTPLEHPDQATCAEGGKQGDGQELFASSCVSKRGADKPYVSYGAPQSICEAEGVLDGDYAEPALGLLCTPGETVPCAEPDAGGVDPDGGVSPDAGDTSDAGDISDAGTCEAQAVAADAPRGLRCEYTNAFDASQQGCRDYPPSMDRAAVEAACKAEAQVKDDSVVIAEGACDLRAADGFCSGPDGSRDVGLTGGCDASVSLTAPWGCAQSDCGVWTCLLEPDAPNARCEYDSPAEGAPSCRSYARGTRQADAAADCSGALKTDGFCDEAGAVGTCLHASGHTDVFISGTCAALRAACDGTFTCQKPSSWGCRLRDTGLGCRFQGGNYICDSCVEYGEEGGWTESSAEKACAELETSLGSDNGQRGLNSTFGDDVDCDALYPGAERCVRDDGTRQYGDLVDDSPQADDCAGGQLEPVESDCAPALTGILTCRFKQSVPVVGSVDGCADYPASAGWDEGSALEHCAGGDGVSDAALSDEPCLGKEGAGAGTRCKLADAAGRGYYAYGVPANTCTGSLNGENQDGPFCEGY